jgi:hypothetical protein
MERNLVRMAAKLLVCLGSQTSTETLGGLPGG